MDRRRTPFSGRIAAARLRGILNAPAYTQGAPARIAVPVADILANPGGARDRQILRGADVRVYDRMEGHAYIEAQADGYCGWVVEEALGNIAAGNHVVIARATHSYSRPDIKSPDIGQWSIGTRLHVISVRENLAETDLGYLPTVAIAPSAGLGADPVAIAARLIGTPYLWGGNSAFGIDCSGLVQLACTICGLSCPGDSDMQAAELGRALPPDAPLRRNDVVFWAGHVGWMEDGETLLHANAHAMCVSREPLAEAVARIKAHEGKDIHIRRRLSAV